MPHRSRPRAGSYVRTLPVERDGLHRHLDRRAPRRRAGAGALHPTVRRRHNVVLPAPISGSGSRARPAGCSSAYTAASIVNLDRASSLKNVADAAAVAMMAHTPLSRPGQPLAPALAEGSGWRKGCIWPSDSASCKCAAARRVGLHGHTSVITGNLPPRCASIADAIRAKNLRSCARPLACACRVVVRRTALASSPLEPSQDGV